MTTIRYTIEGTALGIHPYTGEVEVDDEELEGLSGTSRDKAIEDVVQDEVNNVVQWGWEEVPAS